MTSGGGSSEGRIGRASQRYDEPSDDLDVVRVDDLVGADVIARLARRESTVGPFAGEVAAEGGSGR